MTAPAVVEHGHNGYRRGCRCETCRTDRSRDLALISKLRRSGKWEPWVDAQQVRAHVNGLITVGATAESVARAAAVSPRTVQFLLAGRPDTGVMQRMRTGTARKILAVTIGSPRIGTRRASGIGVARRIQGLCTLGWSMRHQAGVLGWGMPNYHALLDQKFTSLATAAKVSGLYEQLSMTPAPTGQGATRARNDARRKGWFGPLAWDDESIDDPAAMPVLLPPPAGEGHHAEELMVQHLMAGHAVEASNEARLETARRLSALGWSSARISPLVGRSPQWVRLNLPAAREQ